MSKEHEDAVDAVKAAQVGMSRLRPRPGSVTTSEDIAKFETAKTKWDEARKHRVAAARRDAADKRDGGS
jgi:hypothetical protein